MIVRTDDMVARAGRQGLKWWGIFGVQGLVGRGSVHNFGIDVHTRD